MRKPARLPLEALTSYLADRESPDSQIDWHSLFGNDNQIEIEVGCGKGTFLVSTAEAHPQVNYLGVEVLRGLQLYIATRLAKRGLHNARVASADARRLLRLSIPPSSVRAIHVYFPDPWWKKRHHKRRIWTPQFAADCIRALAPGGKLHLATDVLEYYQHIRALLDGLTKLRRLSSEEQLGAPAADECLTNFERKARQKGGSVFRAEYERAVDVPTTSSFLHAP